MSAPQRIQWSSKLCRVPARLLFVSAISGVLTQVQRTRAVGTGDRVRGLPGMRVGSSGIPQINKKLSGNIYGGSRYGGGAGRLSPTTAHREGRRPRR